MIGRILVVDDEANIRTALGKLLARLGHTVQTAAAVPEALEILRHARFQIVISDLRMPGQDGLQLLRQIRNIDPLVDVIMMTAYGTIESAVEAMKDGAYDYIEKPINQERLPILLSRVLEKQSLAEDNLRLRQVISAREEYGNLVGKSDKIAKLYEMIEMLAPTPATVLIQGESGVGKELIARAIHQRSARASGPLISLNCGAIPESLLESELFGFEKGAFTGADSARQGKIEMADRGTLFLDEVGEMNPKTQIELLRVLESRELRRLGGAKLVKVDIRVVAATNKILYEEVSAGRFREDLFYRLNVVPVTVPPLRERLDDLPLLADRFLQEFGAAYSRPTKRLTRDAVETLLRHSWPGNVRELKNLMERLTVLTNDTLVRTEDLPDEYRPAQPTLRTILVPLGEPLEKVEELLIRRTLAEITTHRERAAAILGISPRALHYKLRRMGIESEGVVEHPPDPGDTSKNG
ncbi:sigma-54 dependent transcriptional regulator [uncultured Paludibaculum sp.]|uniref:sigma-54-dependent transcriptional regulator n=1 Tax=uncultured Paludibaculum sp. TaxID=1765020 RepID=UPI002AAAC092|nr:sigma-54 dependent transcriptional regulator [uncultured Paludibaculum sp.]